MADDFKVVFELDVRDAISSAERLATALGGITAGLKEIDQASQGAQSLNISMGRVASSSDEAAKAQARASASIRGYQQNIAKIEKHDAWRNEVKELGEVQAATNRLERAQQNLLEAREKVSSVQGMQPTEQVKAYQQLSAATSEASRAQDNFDRANQQTSASLPTLRYALYDVSNTLFAVGAAFAAVSVAAVGAAISWERSFANVIRTSGAVGSQVDEIRTGLAQLTREIPQSFGDLTEIAALGGQLGIAADGIVDFTRVVAMLTTTTDLSAEAAGTALGRFAALLDVAPSEFEALASAILRTGINSVATETQIVNIATQISSMGDFAGLSAHEVVGLSAALASVGAQPELSRGTITRVFTQMSRAIADGGARLESFADLAGVTGEEFAKAFGTDEFGGLFQTFLANISKEGGNAVQVLNDLGITSVRDVPLLLRLSGATDTVTKAFADAAIGWQRATELQDNYGIVVRTTAERINLLWNAVTELFATLGQGTTGPIADFITGLQGMINGLTDFLGTDFGQRVGVFVVVVTSLVAAFLLLGGVVTRVGAGLVAMRTIAIQISAAMGGLGVSTGVASGVLGVFGVTAGRARIALGLLLTTVKALSIASAVLLLPDIAKWSIDLGKGIRNSLNDIDDFEGALLTLSAMRNTLQSPGELIGNFLGVDWTVQAQMIQDVDEHIASLVASGAEISVVNREIDKFSEALGFTGTRAEALEQHLTGTKDALTQTAQSSNLTTGQMEKLEKAQKLAEEATRALADSLGLSEEGFDSYEKAVQAAAEGAISLSSAVSTATTDGIFSLQKFNDAMVAQVTAFENWERNLNTLLAKGVDFAVIQELVELGPVAGSQLAQGLVENFGTELGASSIDLISRGIAMEQALSDGFIQNQSLIIAAAAKGDEAGAAMLAAITEGASEEKITAIVNQYDIKVPVSINPDPAYSQIDAFRQSYRLLAPIVIPIQVSGGGGAGELTRAQGGPIYGPGTSTSDSIPARLSNGEYVIRASSVRKYGHGFMDQVNRGVAKFASGGPVGSSSMTFPSSMVTEFGPQSMAAVRGSGNGGVTVVLDDVAIARAANRGNEQLTGGNRR